MLTIWWRSEKAGSNYEIPAMLTIKVIDRDFFRIIPAMDHS